MHKTLKFYRRYIKKTDLNIIESFPNIERLTLRQCLSSLTVYKLCSKERSFSIVRSVKINKYLPLPPYTMILSQDLLN